jgi:hypothetical protein
MRSIVALVVVIQLRGVAAADTRQSLDRDDIKTTMDAIKPKIVACNTHDFHGKIRVTVKVAGAGTVDKVTLDDHSATELGKCIVGVIEHVAFPKTQTGGSFTYPLVF